MPGRRSKGEGSLERLNRGQYRAVFTFLGVKYRSRSFPDRRQAAAWLHEKLEEIRKGTFQQPSRQTVAAWLEQWLAAVQSRVEPKSHEMYRYFVQKLQPYLGAQTLGKLTAADVEQILGRMAADGVSAYARAKILGILRMALQRAVKHGLLAANVAANVDKPRQTPRELTCWTAAEAKQFLQATRQRWLWPFYTLALDSGMRIGEMLGLCWDRTDLVEGVVNVQKNLEEIRGQFRLKAPKTRKGRRKIWLGTATVAALRAHREQLQALGLFQQTGPVFPPRHSARTWMRRTQLSRAFHRAIRRAGVRVIRPYDMRHTSATMLLQAGCPLKVVSERLGHENVEMTLKFYVHVLPGQQQEAACLVDRIFGIIPPQSP